MKLRENLSEYKKEREGLIAENIRLKQETGFSFNFLIFLGIVNSIQLTVDFNNRKKRIEALINEKD
jgi:hypothetical protein